MDKNNLEFNIDEELEKEILYSAIESQIESTDSKKTLNTSKIKKRKKSKTQLKIRLRQDIEIKTVLLIIVFLIANTYAWFKYASTASAEIRMHIKDWNFEITTTGASDDLIITADQIYPGMDEVKDSLTAKNNGEMKAIVYLRYRSIQVLDETYKIGDVVWDDVLGENVEISFDYLEDTILKKYPFTVDMYVDGVKIASDDKVIVDTGNEKEIAVAVNWLYEEGTTTNEIASKDLIDTQLGTAAYTFHKDNPDEYSVKIILEVVAEQYDGSSSDTSAP